MENDVIRIINMSAHLVMEELDDFMEVLDNKIAKLSKNLEHLESTQNAAERKALRESLEKDVDTISSNFQSLKFDLKRLPKDREPEYSDILASKKMKFNRLCKRLEGDPD